MNLGQFCEQNLKLQWNGWTQFQYSKGFPFQWPFCWSFSDTLRSRDPRRMSESSVQANVVTYGAAGTLGPAMVKSIRWFRGSGLVVAMAVSSNWLFLWDYTIHKWFCKWLIAGILGHKWNINGRSMECLYGTENMDDRNYKNKDILGDNSW